jgi:hypothetical protein
MIKKFYFLLLSLPLTAIAQNTVPIVTINNVQVLIRLQKLSILIIMPLMQIMIY